MWSIFNTTSVSKEEFGTAMSSESSFVDIKTMELVYKIIFYIYSFVGITSLLTFFHMRKNYVIKQMNFHLTFLNGLFAFISGIVTISVQFTNLPCPVSLFTSNVINPFYNSIFLSRSLRLVLLYQYNIYKVNTLELRKKIYNGKYKTTEVEPNKYLPHKYKVINRIIYGVITVSTLSGLIYTIVMLIMYSDRCPLSTNQSALQQIKTNGKETQILFNFAQIFGLIFAFVLIIMIYFISKVEDNNKYGVKFECWTTSILIITITSFNLYLNNSVNKSKELIHSNGNAKLTSRSLLTIYDYTKGGRALFSIISTYMIFACIILPCIRCWNNRKHNENIDTGLYRKQNYFYKLLNYPPVLEKLEKIAIKDFSVENILFWKNYQNLHRKVFVYFSSFIDSNERERNVDFDNYYQNYMKHFSISEMEDFPYYPNTKIPKELLPYFVNFYYNFIDVSSPAAVNITDKEIKQILLNFNSVKTISVFDEAKNEVVEMMYNSIYPILLKNNKDLSHYVNPV
ncbi:hypothetical protein BCR32DRAFT_291050 [Anaeromyces robustus]|uniref:RGS domain-containing protein n=1 Tax=Anaeromyces robustus TaxID=1754192 RepID=A0A1Y1XGN1_9FUNG|nr:hypothetical protein BCR32DRAFT_291050 [Anaeromyces robustus]|eukprot:ORX84887.1 hypothetical protein BCR32DRAFT_291050 [Anaeromyces robustus]